MAKGFGGRMPGMGGGMNINMLKQAQKMQQDMMKMQQELQEKEYEAAAGGGGGTSPEDKERITKLEGELEDLTGAIERGLTT